MFQHKKEDPSDPFAMLSGGDPPDDYPDWNNPEDTEGAPEGYYDEPEDEDDDSYIPDETDPDFDLSEAHGYAGWDDSEAGPLLPQWLIAAVCIALIIAVGVPALLILH